MLRRLRDSRPTDKASSAEDRRLLMEVLACLLDPAGYQARNESDELKRKLAFLAQYGSPKQLAKIKAAAKSFEKAPAKKKGEKRERFLELADDLHENAQTTAQEARLRDWEDGQVFARLVRQMPSVDGLPLAYHPELSAISEFDPLKWIPVPKIVSSPEWRIKEVRRRVLGGRSTRLKRAIKHSVEVIAFVVPRFEWYRGRLYLRGNAEAVAIVQLELTQGQEGLDGYKRQRREGVGYTTLHFSVRAQISETAIDLDDTQKLPLGIRRFLDNTEWSSLALRAGILSLADYTELTTVKAAAPKDELAEIVRLLEDWGYAPSAIRAQYQKLRLPDTLSRDEKAALISEAIDADRRKVEEEIREAMTVTEPKPARVAAASSGWEKTLQAAHVVALLGPMGSGKSVTAHWLLELQRDKRKPYLLLFPGMRRPATPPWIRLIDRLEDAPINSAILIDESPLTYHARESATTVARLMSKLVGLTRQRHQTLFVVGRLGSEIDRVLIAYSDVVGIKKPLEGQAAFERPALRDQLQMAEIEFRHVKGDSRGWTWVWNRNEGTKEMLANGVPGHWSEELSDAFAEAPVAVAVSRK